MKLYQLQHGEPYEGGYNIGIYRSRERAEKAEDAWMEEYSENDAAWHWTSITELEVED